ncbi:hypothetical protein NA57DRAFT_24272, partial [Rhizodiscina lignyota]
LPDEVIAQIKSSTAITSLTDVILQLIRNSLDAGARKIEVGIDFLRGSCVVEDDGTGIPPSEFTGSGGLGRLYHTSKYRIGAEHYGRNGTFLASLAALALVTVSSQHREYRSTNSLVLHRSNPISRFIPAPPSHELHFRDHGTSVTVRDLFGNMPVRVKQRATFEERLEGDRLWEELKKSIIALLIAFKSPVNLKLRDLQGDRTFNIKDRRLDPKAPSTGQNSLKSGDGASSDMENALFILTQGGMVSQAERTSWVPVSASSGSISIKGIISVDPVPSKLVQFISLDIHPLSANSGHNELFDEISRIFSRSSFGVIEEDPDVDDLKKERRKQDNRIISDDPTNKRFKRGRKGIDKWPMFVFRIVLRDGKRKGMDEGVAANSLENQSHMQAVLEVLSAMVTQWLSSQNFRPRKRQRKLNSNSSSTPSSDLDVPGTPIQKTKGSTAANSLGTGGSETRLDSRGKPYMGIRSFNELSRIKSGNSAFYDTIWPTKATTSRPSPSHERAGVIYDADRSRETIIMKCNALSSNEQHNAPSLSDQALEIAEQQSSELEDGTVTWQDPITKERHRVNARTGAIILPQQQKLVETPRPYSALSNQRKIGGSLPRSKSVGNVTESSNFLPDFLQQWKNPVFLDSQQPIPQVAFDIPGNNDRGAASHRRSLSHHAKYFESIRDFGIDKLSKAGLVESQVIAQVDRKFILIKMPMTKVGTPSRSTTIPDDENGTNDALILVDQHAADERIRVEALLSGLIQPPSPQEASYRSSLSHSCRFKYVLLQEPLQFQVSDQERRLVELHARHFANWSILFDLSSVLRDTSKSTPATSSRTTNATSNTVTVRTLPAVIAERVKSDPKLLITLIRDEIWRLNDPHNRRAGVNDTHLEASDLTDRTATWLAHLGSIPPGLLDMINSRACRSACMFNDVLRMDECEELVRKLERCVFPFMCAHGRPSMVPVVN